MTFLLDRQGRVAAVHIDWPATRMDSCMRLRNCWVRALGLALLMRRRHSRAGK